MEKKSFVLTIAFILILTAGNFFLFSTKGTAIYTGMSGQIVGDQLKNLNLKISNLTFIMAQLVIIGLGGMMFFFKFRGQKEVRIDPQDYEIVKEKKKKSETDLDVLYHLLEKRKRLSVPAIAKLFKIDKEKALEWGKILGNLELVTIEYPAFNEPEIRIKEKKETEETIQEKKDKVKNDIETKELPEDLKKLPMKNLKESKLQKETEETIQEKKDKEIQKNPLETIIPIKKQVKQKIGPRTELLNKLKNESEKENVEVKPAKPQTISDAISQESKKLKDRIKKIQQMREQTIGNKENPKKS